MKILFLDLASNRGVVGCVTDKAVVCLSHIDHRIDDRRLVDLLGTTVKEAGWSYRDLTHIACIGGPGGFTSLRVAVSCANTLCGLLKIPGAAPHLSDLYRARCEESSFLWLHSTRKAELFVRGFGSFAKMLPAPSLVMLNQLAPLLKPGAWTGELLPPQEDVVAKTGMTRATLRPLEDVLPEFLKGLPYASATLTPWYGRGW